MTLKTLPLCALLALAPATWAAVTADEARQLGTTLTEFGATKAGNADGSIPAYTGGLTQAPPGFKPGSGIWVDPFKDEKPLVRIDAKNMAQYADKLSEGQKALLKKYATFHIDVYPSHRTAAYPEKVLKATVRNATTCKTLKDGLALDKACRGGMPFPIPKTGNEVMWNHQLRYQGDTAYVATAARSWVVDTAGRPVLTAQQRTGGETPYYQTDLNDRDPAMFWRTYSFNTAPARKAGEMTGLTDFLDPTDKPRRAWNYTPGQRRVKLAPEFAYDTPVASMGGVTLFDELFVFSGTMDRFDFKLLGKKEMIIPYSGYKSMYDCPATEALQPHHANPDCERWELHRVYVVEATLKPGQRHAYSRRMYYFDEDLSGAALYDAFDSNNQLHRTLFNTMAEYYDLRIPHSVKYTVYDLSKGMYAYLSEVTGSGFKFMAASPDRDMNAEAITSREATR